MPARRRRMTREDIVTLVSLVVAALATVAGLAQTYLLSVERDTPYKTLAYEQRIARSVFAADFMTQVRANMEKWNAKARSPDDRYHFNAQDLEEMRQQELAFAELSEKAWILPDRAQTRIAAASTAFVHYARGCMEQQYSGLAAMPPECEQLQIDLGTTLARAIEQLHEDVKSNYGLAPGSEPNTAPVAGAKP